MLRKLYITIFLTLFLGLLGFLFKTSIVEAANAGDIVEIQGTLETNPNTNYTHKMNGFNFNLNPSVNQFLNSEVVTRVQYTDPVNFKVLSVTTLRANTSGLGSPAPPTQQPDRGSTRTISGVLETNPNTAFTHRIGAFNFILNPSVNSLLGQNVHIQVQYTDGFNFRVLSVQKAAGSTDYGGKGEPGPTSQNGNTFRGNLTLSPLSNRTYRITREDGFFVDIIVSRRYDAWLNSEVILTYSGPLNGFTVLSISKP